MNQLFQQMNQASPKNSLPNNMKQVIQNFKMLSNPEAYIQKAMNENPQLNAVIQAAGGNPEKAFRDMAQKMGVDGDEIIKMLQ